MPYTKGGWWKFELLAHILDLTVNWWYEINIPPPPPPPLFTSYTNSGLKRNKCDVTNFWMNISSWSHINEHIYMYIIKILSSRHPLHMRDTFFFIIHSFFIRTSNFEVKAERKVDVLIFFMVWAWNVLTLLVCKYVLIVSFPFHFCFPATSLYCSSTVESDRKITAWPLQTSV